MHTYLQRAPLFETGVSHSFSFWALDAMDTVKAWAEEHTRIRAARNNPVQVGILP